MWDTPVLIFEDEDEDALISEFVRLSAKYETRDPLEITRYIFRNLRDPELRSGSAAIKWFGDLEIRERIDATKLIGAIDKDIDSKKEKLKVLESIYKSESANNKDRIAALQLHAQMQGEIIKAIEQTNVEKRLPNRIIQVVGDFYDRPA